MFFTNIFFGGGTLDSTLPFFAPEYAPRTAELLAVLALDLYGPYAYGRYGTMPHTLSPCSITITLQYSTRYTHEGAWGCTDSFLFHVRRARPHQRRRNGGGIGAEDR